MTELERTWRRVFPVARQLADEGVRLKAFATLRAKDLLLAVDPETHEPRHTVWLENVDRRREVFGLSFDEWPSRYEVLSDRLRRLLVDDFGREVHPWVEHKPGGLLFVRWWGEPIPEPQKPPFSWSLYERHTRDIITAIQCDAELPETPWHED